MQPSQQKEAAMTENTPCRLGNVITIDDERIKSHLDRVVRGSAEETLNALLDADGQSALNLAAAKLRHIAGTAWSTKRYLNIEILMDQQTRGAITA